MRSFLKFFLLLGLGTLWLNSSAQFYNHSYTFKKDNSKLITKADTFAVTYFRTNEDTFRKQALDIYLDITAEEKGDSKPDTAALIHCNYMIGYIDMIWGEYKWGMDAFYRMLKYCKRDKDRAVINEAIPYLGYCIKQTRLENFTFDLPVFDRTERLEFYFPITHVFPYKKDTLLVKINFGTYDGIGLGAFGIARGVKTDSVYGHNNVLLGNCEVTEIAESQAILKIYNLQGYDSVHKVFPKDMVKLPIQFPKRFHDIITEGLQYNVNFYNIDGYAFYDYRQWYMYGSDSLQDDIVQSMEYDIHKAYEKYKTSDLEVLYKPITEGRFKDKTLLEVLKITTKKDIKDFLYYASYYAASYYGNSSFLVKYADWVVDNAPVSYGEFFEAIDKSTNNEQLKEIAKLYKQSAIDGDYFNYLGNDEEALVNNNQGVRGFELNRKHTLVAEYMGLTEQVGWSYFFKARMYDLYDLHDSVLVAYQNSIIHFKKSKSVRGEAFSIGNLAAKYYDLDDYAKSLSYYRLSYKLKLKAEVTDSSDYYKGLAIALHGMGDNYFVLSKFDSSLYAYTKATVYYNKANSVDARSRSLSAYKYIAKIHKKQGRYAEAFKSYQALQFRYKQLGDQKNVAETYDDLADVLFSLNDYVKSAEYYNIASKMKLSWDNKAGAGFSKSNVGQALYNLGEFDLAILAHDTAVTLRGEANDQAGVAYSLGQIGVLYKENGDYAKATNYLDKAYEIYLKLEDKSSLAGISTKRGGIAQKISNYNEAFKNYFDALNLYRSINDLIEVGNSFYNIAAVYAKQNKFTNAIAFLDSALVYQNSTGDLSGQMYTLNYKGSLTEIQYKNNKKAMDLYRQALAIARLTGSPYNEAVCQAAIANLYANMGEYSKSKLYHDSCYNIYVRIKDRLQQSYSLVNIGYYYTGTGNFKEGEKKFKEALRIAEEIKNSGAIANAYSALGSVGRVTGRFKESIDYLQKSIDMYVKTDNPWGIASNYVEMGNLYNEQSKYTTAVALYMKADSFYKSINSEYFRATPLNNAGTIFYHQGNYDSALTYFYPALEILKKWDPDGDFVNLVTINIGEVFVDKKNYVEAEKWLNLGLTNSLKKEEKRNKGMAYRMLAKYNVGRQKYKEAEALIFKAYEIEGDSGEIEIGSDIYNIIGRVKYELKDYNAAIQWYSKTIKKSEPIGFVKYLYPAYYYSALCYKALGQNDTALRQIKRSIAIMEQISAQITGGAEAQKMFASGDLQQRIYETIVEWLFSMGRIEEALIFLEKGNNEALNAKFKQLKGGDQGNSETRKALSEAEEKQKAIDKINAELIKEKSKPADQQKVELIKKLEEYQQISQKEYNKFFSDLLKSNPKIQLYLSNSVNPEDFKAERKNVSPDMAVLLYMMAEKNLYIFCATKDSVFAKVINIESKELSKKIMTMYNLVRNPSFLPTTRRGSRPVNTPKVENPEKVLNETSKELYNILIGSVKKEIGNKTRLAIIPNGDLYYLPFHALIAKEENAKITYLMDEFTVFYSNRLKFLGSSQTIDMADFRPMAVGNADKSLPNAEVEVNDIKILFPTAMILIGDKATKSELISLSGNYNVLHFATHGILDYNNFDSSYLVMAPDKKAGDDGHFTLNDIGELNKIDEYTMVVLSACETAVKNDLVEGYPQTTASAFLKAGVETVIASLWQVDDKATSLLMKKAYENLKTMNKVEALHQAQVDLSKMPGFSHPYYWAPFAYYGK
jgi:CHAT domain-containing protein